MKYAPGYDIRLPGVRGHIDNSKLNPHAREKPSGAPFEIIGPRSPESWRKAGEQMAGCFKREMKFEFYGYLANEMAVSPNGHLLADDRLLVFPDWYIVEKQRTQKSPKDFVNRLFFYGAISMRAQRPRWNSAPKWTLDWVWFHPFERRRGHLTEAWPFLLKMYPNLIIERPSDAMERFLDKINHPKC
jgi:hypothetical protein